MNRVNGQVEVDRGRKVWELLSIESAEGWWTGGHSACKLESSQMKIGRRLLGTSNTVAGVSAGRSSVEKAGKKEGRNEGDIW